VRPIHAIIVHHTASSTTTTMEEVLDWHVHTRGWDDIGYHFYLQGPLVRAGRPLDLVGAHDFGENVGTIGICVAGDYRSSSPDPDTWYQLVSLCADLCRQYALEAEDVFGHRENEPTSTPTACPGFSSDKLRADINSELHRREHVG
jgi:hypothetical protein